MSLWVFVLITVLAWGLAPIFGKLGLSKVDPLLGLAIRTFTIGIILLVLCLAMGKIKEIWTTDHRTLFFVAMEGIAASLIGHFAYYYALKLGEVSRVYPVIASSSAVTVIASILILGEQFTWTKIAGFLLILGGVILINR